MVPGVWVGLRRCRQLLLMRQHPARLARALSAAMFVPLCVVSFVYHVWPRRFDESRVKRRLLRADYVTQQLAAVAMALGSFHGGGDGGGDGNGMRRRVALASMVALSALSARLELERVRPLVAIQALVALVGLRGRLSVWWMAGLASRLVGVAHEVGLVRAPAARPPEWVWHSLFHAFIIRAFDVHWARWGDEMMM